MSANEPLSEHSKTQDSLLCPQAVLHVKQKHTWDCGLACSVMVLQALEVHAATADAVYGQASAKAVWTIQLAHLLARYGCDVLFSTLVRLCYVMPGLPLAVFLQYAAEASLCCRLRQDLCVSCCMS